MSALKLARGLAGDKPFALIDTESGRAKHYADTFQPWEHGDMAPPFNPAHYAEAITAADKAGYPVIVVDSFSHEHAGDGGLLDMHDAELQRMAGDDWKKREAVTFAAWVKPKGEHKRLISQLLQLRAHLIVCLRAEEKIEIVKEGGKTVVRPKKTLTGLDGWVPVSEKNLPYELTLSFLLTGDAPGVPKPIKLPEPFRAFVPLDAPISEETGRRLGEWARGESRSGHGTQGDPAAGESTPSGGSGRPDSTGLPVETPAPGLTVAQFAQKLRAANVPGGEVQAIGLRLFPDRNGVEDLSDEERGRFWAAVAPPKAAESGPTPDSAAPPQFSIPETAR